MTGTGTGGAGAGGSLQMLAIDLGSSSIRAALVTAEGEVSASARCAAPVVHRDGAAAEIDPEDWWRAVLVLARELAATAPDAFASVAGVVVCGATRIQVLVDARGSPVRHALHWSDTRAESAAARLAGQARGHAEQAHINAFHPLARLAFVAAQEPATFQRTSLVLDPKDFINARLTGRLTSDPVSLARLLAAGAEGDLVAAAVGRGGFAPEMREPWQSIGPVRPGLPPPLDALTGRPVFCGSHDTYAAVVGLGAMRPGYAYNISGTTEVLGVLSAAPVAAEGLISIDWRAAQHIGGPSQNGADTVAWLAAILRQGTDAEGQFEMARLEAALRGPRAAQPVLFLPYLSGERVPYWDTELRGAFLGLSRLHGLTDMVWAVLEGIAFQNRVVLARAEQAVGAPIAELRFGGGGAANAVWRQIKADVLGRDVAVSETREPGLIGAAALGFVGIGHHASLATAQDAMVRIAARYYPDPGRHAAYNAMFCVFQQAEAAVAPVSRALARLSVPGG